MKDAHPKPCKKERREWIRLLANAGLSDLEDARRQLENPVAYKYIVRPETGLLMVQAKADGSHNRFHLGEVSVTKCVLEIEDRYLGYGMVTGSNRDHAELAAMFDGLLQHPDYHDDLKRQLLDKLEKQQRRAARDMEQEAERTRVEFFTLKREE